MSRIIRTYIVDIVETDDVIYCDNDGHLTYNIEAVENELVRCKDCKHKGGNGYDEDVCWKIEPQHGVYVSDNWYCADGERKGGDTE